jgi:peptidoglycan hydrolase-like amidase
MSALDEKRKAKEAEVTQINNQIAQDSATLSVAQNQANKTRSQLDQLTEEQRILREYEESLINQGGGGGTNPVVSGEFYFTGRGRDSVQGHGIGMSQSGILGAALAGWNYQQIVTFYYQNTSVIQYTARTTIPVQGYGDMNVDTYVAGVGEVASTSCEQLGVPFGTYGLWGCWPAEAIKAQVVTSRTYALSYTASGWPICTTSSCQSYIGGEAKRWAADETSYEIVAYGGQPIKAYYSANNNQGYGTAHNDTVWANRVGDGTPYAYLRSVNDNSFYYPFTFSGCGGGDCSTWMYRTNSYSMTEIQGMFEWSITSPSTSITQGDRDFLTGVLNDIGTLSSITFERDPSQRAKRVIVTGDRGSRYMAGWFFKSLWNIWVGNVMPSGEQDYIYSLTYYFLQG